jgi:hypothetical protein
MRPPQTDIKTDSELDGERHFSDCLSFRQRVIAKKAFETTKRNNFSFFNRFFDAIIGISLAESLENPRRRRSCVAFHLIGRVTLLSRKLTANESSTKSNFFVGGIEE